MPFQMFVVDEWIAAEGNKLEYIRHHQDIIRRYDSSREAGLIKLLTSLTGSKRWLRMKSLDSTAVPKHGILTICVNEHPWSSVATFIVPHETYDSNDHHKPNPSLNFVSRNTIHISLCYKTKLPRSALRS